MTDATMTDEQVELLEQGLDRGFVLRSELAALDDDREEDLHDELAARDVMIVEDVADDELEAEAEAEGITTDPVRAYLDRAGTHELLTREDEADLAKRYKAGVAAREIMRAREDLPAAVRARLRRIATDGDRAQEAMATANLRLVIPTAKKYAGNDMPLIEAIQEGNLGLLRAVEKFDHTKGYKFSTYAVWWIRQAIQRGLASSGRTIRVPSSVWEDAAKVRKATARMRTEFERDPTDEEIADAVNLRVDRVQDVRDALRPLISLDKPVGEDGDLHLGGLLPDEEALDPADGTAADDVRARLSDSLSLLPERQRIIIELWYGLGDGETYTYAEIGERLGLNRERIRQLKNEALEQLAVHAGEHGLKGTAIALAA